MLKRLRSLFRVLTSRTDFEDGMTEELRFHIEQYTDDLIRSGVSPEEAGRRACIEFGGVNSVKGDCREARGNGGRRVATPPGGRHPLEQMTAISPNVLS